MSSGELAGAIEAEAADTAALLIKIEASADRRWRGALLEIRRGAVPGRLEVRSNTLPPAVREALREPDARCRTAFASAVALEGDVLPASWLFALWTASRLLAVEPARFDAWLTTERVDHPLDLDAPGLCRIVAACLREGRPRGLEGRSLLLSLWMLLSVDERRPALDAWLARLALPELSQLGPHGAMVALTHVRDRLDVMGRRPMR